MAKHKNYKPHLHRCEPRKTGRGYNSLLETTIKDGTTKLNRMIDELKSQPQDSTTRFLIRELLRELHQRETK